VTQKPFAEKVVYIPFLNLLALSHYMRQLGFPRDLLTAVVFIATGVLISRILPLLPASPLINAAALYLVFLVPVLFARWLVSRQK